MSPDFWLRVLELLWRYGPAVVNLIIELLELINTRQEQLALTHPGHLVLEHHASQNEVALENALDHYKATKDRGPLRALRHQLRIDCGFDCRPTGASNRN